MIKYLLIFQILSMFTFSVGAQEGNEVEILYITDQLSLSLYESADQRSKVLQYLDSGNKLVASKNSGNYAYVMTENGKKGWVKSAYLVSELPTVLLLEQEKEKTKALIQELNKLANSSLVVDQYEKDMDALTEKLQAMTKAKEAVQTVIENIKQQEKENQKKLGLVVEAKKHRADPLELLMEIVPGYWRYLLPICFGFILIGFITAKQLLQARIKKKFQGIKVW
jgi:SH3 domain protein